MTIANDGNVALTKNLTVKGNRTNLIGADGSGNHWIMAGGTVETTSGHPANNAISFNWDKNTKKGIITVASNWTLKATSKVGFVVDRFLNLSGKTLEQGDLVVIHPSASGPLYEGTNRIPLIEVDLAQFACDTRICGVVDEPRLPPGALQDFDPGQVENLEIGTMVTLGAYSTCKVDADIAPIAAGDLLTSSPTPGHAQKRNHKSRTPGATIGKALASLASGKGTIPILVSLQ